MSSEWVIGPRGSSLWHRAEEVWRYRRLFRYFAERSLQRTYKRTVLGRAWLFIRPLFPVLVGTLVFGGVVGIRAGDLPYFLFLMVGTTAWNLFARSVAGATRSLEVNRRILGKTYFPRLILPIAAVAPALLDTAIHVALVLAATAYYFARDGVVYLHGGFRLLWAVLALILSIVLAVGIGLWTSIFAARARDVRFSLGYVMGFWYYLTPVLYPGTLVPERWRWLAAFNPMAALVETVKWSLLGLGEPELPALAMAASIVAVVFASGLRFFHSAEAASVDAL